MAGSSNPFHLNEKYQKPLNSICKNNIKPKNIEQLPLPENKQCDRIDRLIDNILDLKECSAESDTKSIKKDIDQLVYNLYRLTDEEIKIVEGSFTVK
ncbi:MAG: hypothetical protein WCK10_03835 [Candidatus Staskawiczbacteria bacterium]